MQQQHEMDSNGSASRAERHQVKFYYSKRQDSTVSVTKEQKVGPRNGQELSAVPFISGHAAACSELFEIGSFYEIDHESLPPKSPIQLKAIRVVKVTETTRLDVTASFPSMLSLRSFFSRGITVAGGGSPELEEAFVMGVNQAGRILRRQVQPPEQQHQESFWLVSPLTPQYPPALTWANQNSEAEAEQQTQLASSMVSEAPLALTWSNVDAGEASGEKDSPASACMSALKAADLAGWGVQRKVKYVARQRELRLSWQPIKMEGQANMEQDVEDRKRLTGKKRNTVLEGHKKRKEERKKKMADRRPWKRPRRNEREPERSIIKVEVGGEKDKRVKGTQERWSAERYGAAEMKLLEIMREMKAELGSPIMRQALRDQARKHIGDTGLLDHLLKHLAGKIVADGRERFRRRHNAEGAMEYWLEPADLAEVRRMAGVADPYWVPPPGWKLGDSLYPCQCGADCKEAANRLREEITVLSREVEGWRSVVRLEKKAGEAASEACCGCRVLQDNYEQLLQKNLEMKADMAALSCRLHTLHDDYQGFLKWKLSKEEDLAAVSSCLQDLKKKDKGESAAAAANVKVDVGMVMGERGRRHGKEAEKAKIPTTDVASTKVASISSNTTITSAAGQAVVITNSSNGNDHATTTGSGGKASRRSGFTICKPQGTFLWPDMGTSCTTGICVRPSTQRALQLSVVPPALRVDQDHLMMLAAGGIPTPSSASSATSAPRLLLPSPRLPRSQAPELVAVPMQRPGSNDNLSPTALYYPRMPRVPPAFYGGEGGGEKREAAAAVGWESPGGRGWCDITTDLALATPSSSSLSYRSNMHLVTLSFVSVLVLRAYLLFWFY